MSYFNKDQEAYIDSLAKMPPESRCYCGWFPKGECHTCPKDLTLAEKMARWCIHCHNAPPAHDLNAPIIHNIRCTK